MYNKLKKEFELRNINRKDDSIMCCGVKLVWSLILVVVVTCRGCGCEFVDSCMCNYYQEENEDETYS